MVISYATLSICGTAQAWKEQFNADGLSWQDFEASISGEEGGGVRGNPTGMELGCPELEPGSLTGGLDELSSPQDQHHSSGTVN